MTISLCTVETQYHDLAKLALEQTLKHVNIDEVVVFSNQDFFPGSKYIPIEHFSNINDFNNFMIHGMADNINSTHMLFVQWDAMACDSSLWSDSFFNYDYIGAPWPWWPTGENVGNGGFSLRSKKLLLAIQDPNFILDEESEDVAICKTNKSMLETVHDIHFATTDVAAKFSYELGTHTPSFGFHGPWNVIRFADDNTVEFYLEHMDYNSWNYIKWHHVLIETVRRKRIDWFENLLRRLQTTRSMWLPSLINQVENFDYSKDLT